MAIALRNVVEPMIPGPLFAGLRSATGHGGETMRRQAAVHAVHLAAWIALAAGLVALVVLLPAGLFGVIESERAGLRRDQAGALLSLVALGAAGWSFELTRRYARRLRASTRVLGRLPLLLIVPLTVAAVAAMWTHYG